MNAADDRRPLRGRFPFPSFYLLSCAILVALVLASISTNAAAVTKHVGNGSEGRDLERRAKMAALRKLVVRSDRETRSDSDSSEGSQSDSDSSEGSQSASSSSSDSSSRSSAVAAFPARIPVALDPTAMADPAPPDNGFPVPDIFGSLPLFGGIGDVPPIPNALPSGVGDAAERQHSVTSSTQGPSPVQACSDPPVCAPRQVMEDGVSFMYESLFNVVYEIAVVTIPAVLRELSVQSSARECSNVLSKNNSHVVAAIKHGRGDARVTVKLRPGLGPGGVIGPMDAIYTSGDFRGLGQFRAHVTFNRNGEVETDKSLIKFPNTERFVAFPVILQACTRCGVAQSPSFPIQLSLIPTTTSASAKDAEEALTALIEYTCI